MIRTLSHRTHRNQRAGVAGIARAAVLAAGHAALLVVPCLLFYVGMWGLEGAADTGPLRSLAEPVLVFALAGPAASMMVHEWGHLAVLARCEGIQSVQVEGTVWRLSLQPVGTLTPTQAIAVAAAGPMLCGVTGGVLLLGGLGIGWVYAIHLVFLLPPFGDGRSILMARKSE